MKSAKKQIKVTDSDTDTVNATATATATHHLDANNTVGDIRMSPKTQRHKKQKIDNSLSAAVSQEEEEDTYDLSNDELPSDNENESDIDIGIDDNRDGDEDHDNDKAITVNTPNNNASKSPLKAHTTSTSSTSSSTTSAASSSTSKHRDISKTSDTSSINNDTNKVITFSSLGVCAPLCDTLKQLNWKSPTKIQEHGIPLALQNKDIIGLAETGSGKTGCFVIPMLQSLLESPQPYFGLILAPTRELAFQIHEQILALGSGIGVSSVVIVGGVDMMNQAIALAKRPHIIVASPGRIVDHLENTKGFHFKNLKYLVLDEADRLLNMDFEKEIDKILQVIPKQRRTMLFSATMTSKVAKLQRASLQDPVKVEVSNKYSTVEQLIQNYLFIPAKYKEVYLTYLLNELQGQSTIVFCATCQSTKKLALMLRHLGFACLPLHGKMDQQQRLASLNKFRASGHKIHQKQSTMTPLSLSSALALGAGKHDNVCNILICTDVASRGLDIPAVDNVMNYDIPTHSKDYIHRVGRTARAGRSGRAVTFVTQYDVELFQRIESLIGLKMELYPTEEDAVMLLIERVNEAHRIATSELREIEIEKKERRKHAGDDDEHNASIDLSKHKNSSYKKKRR